MKSITKILTLSKYIIISGSHETKDTPENKSCDWYSFSESIAPLHRMISEVAKQNKLPLGTLVKVTMTPI